MSLSFPFRGIQAKTFYIFISVFVVIILPVNFFIFQKVKNSLALSDSRELRLEAEALMGRLTLDPISIPLPSPAYALKIQRNQADAFENIFTSPDFPLLESFQFLQEECESDTFKIVTLAKTKTELSQLLFSVARSNTRLSNQLNDLKFYLFAANILSILIAGMVLWLATGITLRPIKRIIEVASQINAARSMARVPVPQAQDENKLLAQTINAMLERMEKTIQNQTNFFASATHELKTPLAVMQTELSIALQKETNPEILKILNSNLTETQRLDRVIQDFLLLSQLRSDTLVLRKQKIELNEIFYQAVRKVKFIFQEREKTLNVQIAEQPFFVEGDQDKLEAVFTNLLENAARYSPENSVVDCTLSAHDPEVILTIGNLVVRPIQNIDDLASEFRKSDPLSSGLGMGLWICKKILDLHKANLALEQHGSTFRAIVTFTSLR